MLAVGQRLWCSVPCRDLPIPEPETIECKDGQSPKTAIIFILLLLLSTLLHCAGLGHLPRGWEGRGSSKRGAGSCGWSRQPPQLREALKPLIALNQYFKLITFQHFVSENVYRLRKCTNETLSLSQNIFPVIFQGGLIIKNLYQLQSNQDVCVENKILKTFPFQFCWRSRLKTLRNE